MNHDNDGSKSSQPILDNSTGKPFNPLKESDYAAGIRELSGQNINVGGDNFFEDTIKRYIQEGRWVGIDSNNTDNLTWPLNNMPDDGMAKNFIERAVKGIIQSYRDWWEEDKEFKGIYVDPENLLEHFRLDRFDSDDYSRTVTFSLTPDPIFHDDRFTAYGLRLAENAGDTISARIYLHGYDLLPDYHPDEAGLMLPALKDMCTNTWNDYSSDYWLFKAARKEGEVFWHNSIMQSVIYHLNRKDGMTDPMKAFLRIARPNKIPSEEEFVKALDKIKLVEGLE